nr:unnamed protein product [Digitaria exilis]
MEPKLATGRSMRPGPLSVSPLLEHGRGKEDYRRKEEVSGAQLSSMGPAGINDSDMDGGARACPVWDHLKMLIT